MAKAKAKATENPETPASPFDVVIQIDDPSYETLEGTPIKTLTIRPIFYKQWADAFSRAQGRCEAKKDWTSFSVWFREELIAERLHAVGINNQPVELSQHDIGAMPVKYAKRVLTAVLANSSAGAGKITSKGNGIDEACIYKLGTPIKIKAGKDGETTDAEISELEIYAGSMAQVSHVLCAYGDAQVFALLRHCVKPVGFPSMKRLTDNMIDQITPEDGLFIREGILPDFLA
jgi:hypothetical protein